MSLAISLVGSFLLKFHFRTILEYLVNFVSFLFGNFAFSFSECVSHINNIFLFAISVSLMQLKIWKKILSDEKKDTRVGFNNFQLLVN